MIKSDKEHFCKLVNSLGQVLMEIDFTYFNNYEINVDFLESGVYYLVDENNLSLGNKKIIVLKN